MPNITRRGSNTQMRKLRCFARKILTDGADKRSAENRKIQDCLEPKKKEGRMAYSELIKNFEKVRDYMREFYVYGFKRREEYDAKSARSYDI